MIRPLVVKQRRKRVNKKPNPIYSPEEQAQLNLIEISNTDFPDAFRE